MNTRTRSIGIVMLCVSISSLAIIRTDADDTDAEPKLASLYVLAIGIAEYQDAKLDRKYAATDARNLVKVLQDRSAGLFMSIDTRLIVDKEATQQGVLDGLEWLKQKMSPDDIGIVFYSGLGDTDPGGRFYFLPTDVDKARPLVLSAVSDAQVHGILSQTPGRLLLMLDADHAGNFAASRRKNATALVDNLVGNLPNHDHGVVVMSSSKGREVSLVNEVHKSGVFTLAVIEGLSGKADFNQDTFVYFNELDTFVSDRVKELTEGKQHPVSAKPSTIHPFPLTTVK